MPSRPIRSTRRAWLTHSAAIGTALAAPHLLRLPAVHAAGDDRIRVGLVGCGGRGMGAASQTLSVAGSNVVLTAVADAFEQRALGAPEGLKGMHGAQVDVPTERHFFGFDAHRQLLEHCDLVLLCTPPAFRPFQFQAAVEAGKHVFMEKPICVDAHGARMALAAAAEADRKNLKVVVGLQKRYEPWYQEIVRRVRDGAISQITSAQVYRMAGPMWYKTREGASELQFQVNNWTHFNWLCPGVQVEGHVHELDIVNWLLDAHPLSASGMGGQQGQPRDLPSEVFDHFSIEYRYPNDVVVNSQARQMPGCKNDVREEYRGTKGILRAPMGEMRDSAGNFVWRYEPAPAASATGDRPLRALWLGVPHADVTPEILVERIKRHLDCEIVVRQDWQQALREPNFANGFAAVIYSPCDPECRDMELVKRARLTAANPPVRATFRNLGWSGDTPSGLSRGSIETGPDRFAVLKSQLAAARPTVLFVGYCDTAGIRPLITAAREIEPSVRCVLVSPIRPEALPPPGPTWPHAQP